MTSSSSLLASRTCTPTCRSGWAHASSTHRVKVVVRAIGPERVLFGSDFPYFNPEGSLDVIEACGLSEGERDAVCSKNARRLFALSDSEQEPAAHNKEDW
jgi:predicted TIM-barrel fold metal-dependent hydrolase